MQRKYYISRPKSTKHPTARCILSSSIRSESTNWRFMGTVNQSINYVSKRSKSALDVGYGVNGGIIESSCLCKTQK